MTEGDIPLGDRLDKIDKKIDRLLDNERDDSKTLVSMEQQLNTLWKLFYVIAVWMVFLSLYVFTGKVVFP